MKVFIYSIPRPSAFGIHDWTSDNSGVKLLKTKIGGCRDKIQPLYSPKVGGYLNGLSYKPWMEDGKPVTDSTGKALTLQDKMEKKWGLEKGFLTNRAWRKNDSLKNESFTFYDKTSWALKDGCTVLDTANMEDELGYYVALDSKYVANSEKEWREHKWPKALYYIALENEAEEIKYSKKLKLKSKAFANLHAESFTPSFKEKMVALLELTKTTSSLTQEQIQNLLFDYIDKTTFTPNSNIDKFGALFSLLATPVGREEFEAKYLFKRSYW